MGTQLALQPLDPTFRITSEDILGHISNLKILFAAVKNISHERYGTWIPGGSIRQCSGDSNLFLIEGFTSRHFQQWFNQLCSKSFDTISRGAVYNRIPA